MSASPFFSRLVQQVEHAFFCRPLHPRPASFVIVRKSTKAIAFLMIFSNAHSCVFWYNSVLFGSERLKATAGEVTL